jgi:hypothetical protein
LSNVQQELIQKTFFVFLAWKVVKIVSVNQCAEVVNLVTDLIIIKYAINVEMVAAFVIQMVCVSNVFLIMFNLNLALLV